MQKRHTVFSHWLNDIQQETQPAAQSEDNINTPLSEVDAAAAPLLPQTAANTTATAALPRYQTTPRAKPEVINISLESEQILARPDEPVRLNVENIPVPQFINEVYGHLLHFNYELSPALQKKKDLVTLRLEGEQSAAELYNIANTVLNNYGIGIKRQGEVLYFISSNKNTTLSPPLLVSGMTLPEVPNANRIIFQQVPLSVVSNVSVTSWLKKVYQTQGLKVLEDPGRNAVILVGNRKLLKQAMQSLKILDQPSMKGQFSLLVNPFFLSSNELAQELLTALTAQGYAASTQAGRGSIFIHSLEKTNQLLIFAASKKVLAHVQNWIKTLDTASIDGQQDEDIESLFYYEVKNTSADAIAKTLNQLSSRQATLQSSSGGNNVDAQNSMDNTYRFETINDQQLVVDEARNALLFQGTLSSWKHMHKVILRMDIPPKQVLIEVSIAEIQLIDNENFGIEWLFKGSPGDKESIFSTLGGLGVGAGNGFTFTLNVAGQTRAVLNAMQENKQVTILSTPRLMVQSGYEANMEVGTEIAILTTQETSADGVSEGTSNIVNQIQYRKTGILLTITPTVHSGNRVELAVVQEVSQANANSFSGIDSPDIFNRKVNTTVSLKDGGSVLLAGLIRDDRSNAVKQVPRLGDIPIVGLLFRNNTEDHTRTELVIMIRPYIIETDAQAVQVRNQFLQQLKALN